MTAASRAEAGGPDAGSSPQEAGFTWLKPTRGWSSLKLRELWEHREIVYYLSWRDIKVRYKQTVLGMAWAVLQPFLTMLIFAVIFGRLVEVPSDGLPYPLFAYSALVVWTFFANGVTNAANSMILEANMIKKIYFPRMSIPISAIASGAVDFVLAFLVLAGMLVYYGKAPAAGVALLPLFFLLALAATLGMGFWLSALNVLFRDVRYVIPFLIQVLLFLSPIAYSSSLLPEEGIWPYVYGLNPMAAVVNGFRWSILGVELRQPQIIATGAATALLLLFSGAYFFRRTERIFADVV